MIKKRGSEVDNYDYMDTEPRVDMKAMYDGPDSAEVYDRGYDDAVNGKPNKEPDNVLYSDGYGEGAKSGNEERVDNVFGPSKSSHKTSYPRLGRKSKKRSTFRTAGPMDMNKAWYVITFDNGKQLVECLDDDDVAAIEAGNSLSLVESCSGPYEDESEAYAALTNGSPNYDQKNFNMIEGKKTASIKYPNIVIDLMNIDGNAYSIMGAAQKAMRRGGVSAEEIKAYLAEATSGDYDHLLQTTMRWIDTFGTRTHDDDYDEDDYDEDDDDDDHYSSKTSGHHQRLLGMEIQWRDDSLRSTGTDGIFDYDVVKISSNDISGIAVWNIIISVPQDREEVAVWQNWVGHLETAKLLAEDYSENYAKELYNEDPSSYSSKKTAASLMWEWYVNPENGEGHYQATGTGKWWSLWPVFPDHSEWQAIIEDSRANAYENVSPLRSLKEAFAWCQHVESDFGTLLDEAVRDGLLKRPNFTPTRFRPSSETQLRSSKKIAMDPVGSEDEDIDNDGDTDESDSYLHNRRDEITDEVKSSKIAMDPVEDGDEDQEDEDEEEGDYIDEWNKNNPDDYFDYDNPEIDFREKAGKKTAAMLDPKQMSPGQVYELTFYHDQQNSRKINPEYSAGKFLRYYMEDGEPLAEFESFDISSHQLYTWSAYYSNGYPDTPAGWYYGSSMEPIEFSTQ